jgi:hypothetical protein
MKPSRSSAARAAQMAKFSRRFDRSSGRNLHETVESTS